MPIIEYMCEKCNVITEEYEPINSNNEWIFCWKCKGKANRIISSSTFVLKGGGVGWYAESYSKKGDKGG